MPWPLVSRSRHDRELAALERLLALAEKAREDAKSEAEFAGRLYEMERRRYDELLNQQKQQAVAAKTKSKATEVIRDTARGSDGRVDQRLVAHLRGQYNRLLREGSDPEDALEAITQWESTDKSSGTIEGMMKAAGGLKG